MDNPTTIGQQIKAKYPQYAQYPDDVIGRRWLAVYQKKAGGGAVNPSQYLGGQQMQQQAPNFSILDYNNALNQQNAPDLSAFETPQAPQPTATQSVPLSQNVPNLWERFTGFLGATPKQGQDQQTDFSKSISRYNFGGIKI
jgi:hypothetical protein